VQHLVVDSHTVCTHGPKNLGDAAAPALWDVGVADPLEICFSPPVTVLPCYIWLFCPDVKPYEYNYGD